MSSLNIINPLDSKNSVRIMPRLNNDSIIPVMENNTEISIKRSAKQIFKFLTIIGISVIFFIIVPIIELCVGNMYNGLYLCTIRNINGTQVLLAKGSFGIIYVFCSIVNFLYRPNFDISKSFLNNMKRFHPVHIVVTIIYATLHVILMCLEFAFLDGCKNMIHQVVNTIWISAFTTMSAILYTIYKILSVCLC